MRCVCAVRGRSDLILRSNSHLGRLELAFLGPQLGSGLRRSDLDWTRDSRVNLQRETWNLQQRAVRADVGA